MADRDDVFWVQKNGQVEKIGEIRFDVPLCPDCAPRGKIYPVFLLCCWNTELQGGRTTQAIALQAVDILRLRFRRVGLVWGIEPEFWKHAPSVQMTIE